MSIQGKARTQSTGTSEKYVGLTSVEVKAINPTREQLNELLGKEDSDEDKPLEYIGEDKEGNTRVRLAFWLYDKDLDKYFLHSFNITNKVRMNKDETKKQYINNVCMSSWADDPANLASLFTEFTNKEKEVLGKKKYHEALMGEEELATIVRSWLGRLDWNDPESGVTINTKALFEGDFSELQGQIGGDYDTPFVALAGVRTDESDATKQYQQIYGKSFLPNGFMAYIKKGKFPTPYTQKTWKRFEEESTGEYGFNAHFELVAIKVYDSAEDAAQVSQTENVTPKNAKY